jgi:uncharacterized membrane protein YjgN (DUF898 family)
MRNLVLETNNLHSYVINPLVTLFAEFLIVFGLCLIMILVDAKAFLIIICIALPFLLIYLYFARNGSLI